MKNRLLALLTVLALLCTAVPGLAEVDYAADYETALTIAANDLMNTQNLQVAIDILEELGSYKLSKNYVQYLQAILDLQQKEPKLREIRSRIQLCGRAPAFAEDLAERGLPTCAELTAYVDARQAELRGNFETALDAYASMTVLDSAERAWGINATLQQQNEVKKGDYVIFGHYEQDNNLANGPEPIEWLVLEVSVHDQALLISKYCLEQIRYHARRTHIAWEACDLRQWLNTVFYNSAFDEDEKRSIIETNITNPGNSKDNVFILSAKEAYEHYFDYYSDYNALHTIATEFACRSSTSGLTEVKGQIYTPWWLRSKENSHGNADLSVYQGYSDFIEMDRYEYVRPAIWVDTYVLKPLR